MKQLAVLGTSHRVAGLELRERLALSPAAAGRLAQALAGDGEAAVLSTCNRTELYLASRDPEPIVARARAELARLARLPERELAPLLIAEQEEAAVRHLFRVAAGLDSLVPGEPQILGQVREAHATARAAAATGPLLNRLFFDAVGVGKRVRSETALAEQPTSVATAAAELVRRLFGELAGRRVLIIGAGKMSEVAASDLIARGAQKVFVANRTHERAQALASRFGGEPVRFEGIVDELARADVVVSSTHCPYPVVTAAQVREALQRRSSNRGPLLFVDIAVPRDIDPAVRQIAGCALYDIDDLGAAARAQLTERDADLERADAIVAEELARFERWRRSLAAHPAIVALRRHAEEIRAAELARANRQLGTLAPDELAAVDALTVQILNKLLHAPTVRLKAAAASGDGIAYAAALEHLFALQEEPA